MARPAPRGARAPDRPLTERRRMLDLRREGHFRYDLRGLLAVSSLPPEQAASFCATVVSKGARLSARDAKEWVTLKLEASLITKADRDAIHTLIDRYSKWR